MDTVRPDSPLPKPRYGSWALLIVLTGITPFLYAYVQAYLAQYIFPVIELLSATGQIERIAIMVSMNFIGAILCAAMVAAPAMYLLRIRTSLAVGVIVAGLFAFKLSIDLEMGFSRLIIVNLVPLAEYINILIAFWLMASLGVWARTRKVRRTADRGVS
jgi:hypothetical protein